MIFPFFLQFVDRLDGANARHILFWIRIRKHLLFGLPILGQEIAEVEYLSKFLYYPMLLVWGISMWMFELAGVGIITASFLIAVAAVLVVIRLFRPLTTAMELRGHAVEATWASDYLEEDLHNGMKYLEGMTSEGYWLAEAIALANYPQFKNWSQEQIVEGLEAQKPYARKWVDSRKDTLTRKYSKRLWNDLSHRR